MKKETIIIEKSVPNIPWEGCVNGVNYRVERGVPVEVPDFIAELIRRSELEQSLSEARTRAYSAAAGAKLS